MPEILTVRDHIAWSYANLARAHAAKTENRSSYKTKHHIIRNKMFHGLRRQEISMRSLYDDERLKMKEAQCCVYCGSTRRLTLDHLLPRIKGGADAADNIVWACQSCNSSKSDKDMISWMRARGRFPSILLLRRYLKLVFTHMNDQALLDVELSAIGTDELPFDLFALPFDFPPLDELVLWMSPSEATSSADAPQRSGIGHLKGLFGIPACPVDIEADCAETVAARTAPDRSNADP